MKIYLINSTMMLGKISNNIDAILLTATFSLLD